MQNVKYDLYNATAETNGQLFQIQARLTFLETPFGNDYIVSGRDFLDNGNVPDGEYIVTITDGPEIGYRERYKREGGSWKYLYLAGHQ